MFFTLDQLQSYFKDLGYTVDIEKDCTLFTKDGNFIAIPNNTLSGTLQHVRQEVEIRFESANQYINSSKTD